MPPNSSVGVGVPNGAGKGLVEFVTERSGFAVELLAS